MPKPGSTAHEAWERRHLGGFENLEAWERRHLGGFENLEAWERRHLGDFENLKAGWKPALPGAANEALPG